MLWCSPVPVLLLPCVILFLCYGFSSCFCVNRCYGFSLCYGVVVTVCYDVCCVMVLARVTVLTCVLVFAYVMVFVPFYCVNPLWMEACRLEVGAWRSP